MFLIESFEKYLNVVRYSKANQTNLMLINSKYWQKDLNTDIIMSW